jgi:hypothetical protein
LIEILKRNKMKKIAIYILGAALFSSCFEDTIKPDILKDYTPKLVVNSLIAADDSISIEITTSVAAIDNTFPNLVKDAKITINDGSQEIRLVYRDSTETYSSPQTFAERTRLEVRVTHPDYPNVISTVFIPADVNSVGLLTVDGGIDTGGLVGDLIQVSFADPGNQDNYYRLKISYFSETVGVWVPFIFPKSDPSLAGYNSFALDDLSILFNDELFNGQNKTFSTVAPSGIVSRNTGDKFRVEFTSISKDYFEYYRSLQRATDARDLTFQGSYNNAVVIHTNVINGLGIIGTASGVPSILR